MKQIYPYNKAQLLKRIHKKWTFKTAPSRHDIPLPIYHVETQKRCISIPLEVLSVEEYPMINQILRKLSKEIYLKDSQDDMFILNTYELDVFDEVNAMYFDLYFDWVFCLSGISTETGVALVFGGDRLVNQIEAMFKHKKEYISVH